MAGGSIAVYTNNSFRIGATTGVSSVRSNPEYDRRVQSVDRKGAGFAGILATEIDRYKEPVTRQAQSFSYNHIGTPAAYVRMQVLS